MVNIQTGNMLDVIVEGKSIGLKQRDSDHRKYDVIWLPAPEGLRDVLAAEITRLNPPEKQAATTLTSNEGEERSKSNLTKHDKTRFLERGFTVVENVGHSLRLIKRDDARQAISIKWDDLSALRELITLALDDGPMVIGLDTSGQAVKHAVTQMRNKCVTYLQTTADALDVRQETECPRGTAFNSEAALRRRIATEIQSLSL